MVKRALATALDKHDREREMTSVLLSTLYNEVGGWVLCVCVCVFAGAKWGVTAVMAGSWSRVRERG